MFFTQVADEGQKGLIFLLNAGKQVRTLAGEGHERCLTNSLQASSNNGSFPGQ
ncbi:hypothetical protein D3C87_2203220 [compost metagenome]